MTDTAMVVRRSEGGEPARSALIDEQVAGQLLGKAQAGGAPIQLGRRCWPGTGHNRRDCDRTAKKLPPPIAPVAEQSWTCG
jgi:hypothetical protein